MIIGVNCGHTISGTIGCGAVGRIDESVETRLVGNKLIELLKAGGHTVINCTNDRASSVSENLNEICRMANAQYLDLFVSIHFNAGGGKGVEVYTYGGKKFDAATDACNYISNLGFNNRGIKDGSNLAVVRRTDAKSMLIEVCFVDSDDADVYKKMSYTKIAEAIYKGITGSNAPTVTSGNGEYTTVNDIIWELHHREVLTNKSLWLEYCNNDVNVYWFCRKLCQYIRTKKTVEKATNVIEKENDILWDLNYRKIISDVVLWDKYMHMDKNVYYLLRNGLHYCRTH